jgi:hypothetical protein
MYTHFKQNSHQQGTIMDNSPNQTTIENRLVEAMLSEQKQRVAGKMRGLLFGFC